MKLATARIEGTTRAVRVDGDTLVDLGHSDLGELLAQADWKEAAASAAGHSHPAAGVELAPLVPRPSKVVCVGLNYKNHIQEMGRDLPVHPTLFSKFADTLVGATDDILRPDETEAFDWEVELAVVVGTQVRRATTEQAEAAIAGFTVLNDVTCRDWQFRTKEWLQGKNWEATTPVGPYLVTPDELPGGVRPTLDLRLLVDGEVMQADNTSDLLFDPVALVEYVSTMIRLNPGDLIATGTPGGVGHARKPQRYLLGGETVVAEVDRIGRLENRVVKDGAA
jgi:2-keto-4-pentenoate hydratase/2-oxohepta-3-ene-1,7-dioic acid hydratase in catechol pathway